MKNFLAIAGFAIFVSLFYTLVGNMLPQLESKAPPSLKLGQDMSADDLVAAGSSVFDANCAQCHKIGGASRCPDLAGMGQRAHERAAQRSKDTGKAFDDLDYLHEAICEPGNWLVPEFGNIMPPQGKILSPGQIVAVTAFLQDQGGEVKASLTGPDVEKDLAEFGCLTGAGGGAAPAAEAKPAGTPDEIWVTFGCGACHALDKPDRLIGPSLQDVGKRLDKGQIYEAILNPDATIAQGDPPYPPGMMSATLKGNGFYDRMKPGDYQALVDWLAGHHG